MTATDEHDGYTGGEAMNMQQEIDLIDAKSDAQMWRRIALALYAEAPPEPDTPARLALRYAVEGHAVDAINVTPTDFWGSFAALFAHVMAPPTWRADALAAKEKP